MFCATWLSAFVGVLLHFMARSPVTTVPTNFPSVEYYDTYYPARKLHKESASNRKSLYYFLTQFHTTKAWLSLTIKRFRPAHPYVSTVFHSAIVVLYLYEWSAESICLQTIFFYSTKTTVKECRQTVPKVLSFTVPKPAKTKSMMVGVLET